MKIVIVKYQKWLIHLNEKDSWRENLGQARSSLRSRLPIVSGKNSWDHSPIELYFFMHNMASINKEWSNCLIWVTINPCLSRICLYSDAVRSFPPVATNMASDSRRARFGPRLSSSKIFSQIRSPPPNKQTLKTKGVVTTNFDILGFFLPILSLNATYVSFNKGKYMVKRRVIKTFSGYSEDTTVEFFGVKFTKGKTV